MKRAILFFCFILSVQAVSAQKKLSELQVTLDSNDFEKVSSASLPALVEEQRKKGGGFKTFVEIYKPTNSETVQFYTLRETGELVMITSHLSKRYKEDWDRQVRVAIQMHARDQLGRRGYVEHLEGETYKAVIYFVEESQRFAVTNRILYKNPGQDAYLGIDYMSDLPDELKIRNMRKIVNGLRMASQFSFAQQRTETPQADSTLMKMVRGIRKVIDNRAQEASYPDKVVNGSFERVFIQGITGGIPIDSLYKYSIYDFNAIHIDFDISLPSGGPGAQFGVITLEPQGYHHSDWQQKTFTRQQTEIHESDSALMKMVRGIREVIENRARDDNYAEKVLRGWPDWVSIWGERSGGAYIDSLYKYDIRDFRSIRVAFDIPRALGGSQVYYGVIYLHPQDGRREVKKKKKRRK